MNRVFVEVDDSLILWPPASAGDFPISASLRPLPNQPLIDALLTLNGLVQIHVWSRAGCRYASDMAEKFLVANGVHVTATSILDGNFLFPGDVYVGRPLGIGNGMSADSFVGYADQLRAEWDNSHKHAVHGG